MSKFAKVKVSKGYCVVSVKGYSFQECCESIGKHSASSRKQKSKEIKHGLQRDAAGRQEALLASSADTSSALPVDTRGG